MATKRELPQLLCSLPITAKWTLIFQKLEWMLPEYELTAQGGYPKYGHRIYVIWVNPFWVTDRYITSSGVFPSWVTSSGVTPREFIPSEAIPNWLLQVGYPKLLPIYDALTIYLLNELWSFFKLELKLLWHEMTAKVGYPNWVIQNRLCEPNLGGSPEEMSPSIRSDHVASTSGLPKGFYPKRLI